MLPGLRERVLESPSWPLSVPRKACDVALADRDVVLRIKIDLAVSHRNIVGFINDNLTASLWESNVLAVGCHSHLTAVGRGCGVAVVLVAFCVEVLDRGQQLSWSRAILNVPQTTLTVLVDTNMTRSDSVNTIKGSYIARRSSRPFLSSAEVVESTVVVGGVVLTVAALTTKRKGNPRVESSRSLLQNA